MPGECGFVAPPPSIRLPGKPRPPDPALRLVRPAAEGQIRGDQLPAPRPQRSVGNGDADPEM